MAQAAVLSSVALGGIAITQADKVVTLTVDGATSTVHSFGSTVADLLDGQGITVGQHDLLIPGPDAPLSDGQSVALNYARKFTVNVDGSTTEFFTTARTVDAALGQLGIRTEGAELSVSRSLPLGRAGLAMTVTTPKTISILADGKTVDLVSTAGTVDEALREAGVTVGAHDRVTPVVTTALFGDSTVQVQRVRTASTAKTEKVAYSTTKKSDAALYKGQSKTITKGVAGAKVVIYAETYVDGVLIVRRATSTHVVKTPVTAVVAVGTKPAPRPRPSAGAVSGAGLNLANSAMWDRIASCESGGNWHINTGNGYYGGLQFL
ncbi:MAG TPA: ubiquitin-like domain-containing protein, partial [Candidatus Lustribacter sp.]|nr:ubiquitin-like domain-containing protein [Candidatus Lustribacter sp.]